MPSIAWPSWSTASFERLRRAAGLLRLRPPRSGRPAVTCCTTPLVCGAACPSWSEVSARPSADVLDLPDHLAQVGAHLGEGLAGLLEAVDHDVEVAGHRRRARPYW